MIEAFVFLLVTQAAEPAGQALYRPPVVRPFEPPSDFGRERAQGDEGAALLRRPLDAPVVVDAYGGAYEVGAGDVEVAYDQGVSQAEIDMDRRMGPLDGRWRVRDPGGVVLFSLVLRDDDGEGAVEGGWSRQDILGANGGANGRRDSGSATLTLDGAGQLTLTRTADSWAGFWRQGETLRAVTVTPGA